MFGTAARTLFVTESNAIDTIRCSLGMDLLKIPAMWEFWLARQLGGTITSHQAEWDVEVEIWGRQCHVEAKFSNAYFATFGLIRGRNYSRNVFKWGRPRGCSGKNGADCIVFMGLDVDGLLYVWVVPLQEVPMVPSITISAPSGRLTNVRGRMDDWNIPPDEVLPAVARICHNRHDRKHRDHTRRYGCEAGQLEMELGA